MRFHKIIIIKLGFILFVINNLCSQGLLLKNYRPVSIYNIPKTNIARAAFSVIDIHSHDYAETQKDIDIWIANMDKFGVEKTIILSFKTGNAFDSVIKKYSRYPNRFEIWCGFDFNDYDKANWQQRAVAELERCYKMGAKGVGEFSDKGSGEITAQHLGCMNVHIDAPQMKPLLQKCAELKMPINIHVAEDEWMYQKPDSTNDGMMNAGEWHVETNIEGKLNYDALIVSLENAVKENPKTTFIACHLANCCSNLMQLSNLLDKYPNLYADIAARYAEISPVPKYTAAFIQKYSDRILYGTDMGFDESMYATTFRILETADEHFYEIDLFNYHWALYGLNLSKKILRKLYNANAAKIYK